MTTDQVDDDDDEDDDIKLKQLKSISRVFNLKTIIFRPAHCSKTL